MRCVDGLFDLFLCGPWILDDIGLLYDEVFAFDV